LKRGDNGAAVKQLQEKLNSSRALPKLQQDSSFGQHTEDAVKYFQRKNHLKVSGLVDEDTQQALGMIRSSNSPWYEQLSRKFHNFIAGR
jgi:peptidoglycan hydrolase-like protein with peptidoglycan-binding domain